MLNTNSTATTQSLNIANVLLNAHWQKAEDGVTGAIFSSDHFAHDWNSVYVQPFELPQRDVEKNMRKIVEPTLVITQKKAKMAFVLASENYPVYLPYGDKEYGYIMAFRLAPVISEEYVYYMCLYDIWSNLLAHNIDNYDVYNVSWKDVGTYVEGGNGTGYYITAESVVRSVKKIEIPSLTIQQERVNAAKAQAGKIQNLSTISEKELKAIVDCCLAPSVASGGIIFKLAKPRIGLLRELYKLAAGASADSKVIEILSDEEFPFCAENSSMRDLTILSNNLSRVFPMLVNSSEFSWTNSPDYLQPKEVTDFIVNVAKIPAGEKVFNPFAGLSSYAVALPNNSIVGEEINRTTWAIGQIRIFANGVNAQISNEDAFNEIDSDTKYSVIISSPAYLRERGHEIQDIIERLYAKLSDNGRLVCLVPHSFLSSIHPKTKSLREKLVAECAIKSVITLPANIFPGTGFPQDVLFIEKGNPEECMVMADAGGFTRFAKSSYRSTTFDWEQFVKDMEEDLVDFCERGEYVVDGDVATIVKYSDLIGSNLSPEIYLTPKPTNGKPLSALAEDVKELHGDDSADYFIKASSLPEALHRKPFVPYKEMDNKESLNKSHVLIAEDVVLVAIVGGNIRTVYMENFHEKISFIRGVVKVLKPRRGISAKYLAALLSTKLVAGQIKAQAVGALVPRLSRLDLTQIFVPDYKTDEEKQKLISEVLSSEMSELERELKETLESQKREVRSTRHAMIQTLSALSSNWQQLNMFAQKSNGQINFADIVSRVNPISAKELMDSIGYAISTLERQVDSLRFEKADWGEEVDVNPYGFINDYIHTHSTPDVRMVNVGSDNSADLPNFNEVTGDVTYYHTDAYNVFSAPLRLLERIFDNIVANAKAHGFISDRDDHEIRFDWQEDNGNVVITIANNGLPLKEGVSSDDVLMSGFSTALNENSSEGTLHFGQGGFEIKSLMAGLGSVEVISEPDAEFPVIYKLTFTKTNTVRIL